jgi:hypothetical protein
MRAVYPSASPDLRLIATSVYSASTLQPRDHVRKTKAARDAVTGPQGTAAAFSPFTYPAYGILFQRYQLCFVMVLLPYIYCYYTSLIDCKIDPNLIPASVLINLNVNR